jgi:dTDP-4-dehydrorhamnose 3,5-epimerase
MRVIQSGIDGLLVLEPRVFGDSRGFFLESWNEREFCKVIGFNTHFVQDNHSRSSRAVLRGLHYQQKHPQGKLVRVVSGAVWDVAVDLRIDSQSFGQSFGCELTAENHRQLWVPPGFAHGFLVLSDTADFLYKTTDYWMPAYERSLLWSDQRLGIDWPLEKTGPPKLATKDLAGKTLAEIQADQELPELTG